MESPFFVLVLSSIIYLFRISFFLIGFIIENIRTKKFEKGIFEPKVSVIIPARNEEKNIEEALTSFKNVNYPVENYEIIVVNDRSTDKTKEKIEKMIKILPNVKLIDINDDKEKRNIPGKAGAVHIGVLNSQGEIIFVTDADCKVHPNWIKKLTKIYQDPRVGFVTSFTNVQGSRLFDTIQAIEWIYMHTMAMGGVGLNQPLGCYGNNLTFRKEHYFAFGGYEKIPFSVTEDLALQKAFHRNNYKLHYLVDKETIVDTKPCESLKEYFHQHHRWARGGLNLGWRAAIFVLSSFAIWAGLIYFSIIQDFLHLALLLLIRILGDTLLLIPPIIILRKPKLLLFVPFAIPFFLIVELIIPFVIFKRKVYWKNQIFTST